jgi:hypothetical protein
MTWEAMETVTEKAAKDAKFREALSSDPDKTLSAYDLTEEEIAQIKAVPKGTWEGIKDPKGYWNQE